MMVQVDAEQFCADICNSVQCNGEECIYPLCHEQCTQNMNERLDLWEFDSSSSDSSSSDSSEDGGRHHHHDHDGKHSGSHDGGHRGHSGSHDGGHARYGHFS